MFIASTNFSSACLIQCEASANPSCPLYPLIIVKKWVVDTSNLVLSLSLVGVPIPPFASRYTANLQYSTSLVRLLRKVHLHRLCPK